MLPLPDRLPGPHAPPGHLQLLVRLDQQLRPRQGSQEYAGQSNQFFGFYTSRLNLSLFQTQLKTGSGTIQEREKEAKSLKEDLRKCDGSVEHLREEVKRLESVKEELKICNNDKDRLNKDKVDQQEQAGREARKAQDALNQEVAKVKEEKERLSRRLDELQEELDKEKEQVKKAEAEVGSLKADQLQSAGHVKVPCTT